MEIKDDIAIKNALGGENDYLEDDSSDSENTFKTSDGELKEDVISSQSNLPAKDNFLYRYEQNGIIVYDSSARMVG